MDPKEISIADYNYQLSPDRIAAFPLKERDASKLLVYDKGIIREDIYRNIQGYLPPNALLVFNNTKVVEARILFQKPTGGIIEIFCLEPHPQYADITTAMLQQGKVTWMCLIGGASKWKHGQVLEKKLIYKGREMILQARYLEKAVDEFAVELSWTDKELSFAELLHAAGSMPLPPYIKRLADETDVQRYQTIYAENAGAVAAPTAGLHFTDEILKHFPEKNIHSAFVTLHVGAGTFKPVKAATMEAHEMHAEFIEVTLAFIETLIDNLANPIAAVGTTSLRTLESLYWLGLKTILHPSIPLQELTIHQWDAYSLDSQPYPAAECLKSLADRIKETGSEKLVTKTQLLIVPGYDFKIVQVLVTNFHLPQSTLLMLVAAFIGNDWKKVYQYALENNFRLLSYGDGSLLFRNQFFPE